MVFILDAKTLTTQFSATVGDHNYGFNVTVDIQKVENAVALGKSTLSVAETYLMTTLAQTSAFKNLLQTLIVALGLDATLITTLGGISVNPNVFSIGNLVRVANMGTNQGTVNGSTTFSPSFMPTMNVGINYTLAPTSVPSSVPTSLFIYFSSNPSFSPSSYPSSQPSNRPSNRPSDRPSDRPSNKPSRKPSGFPSNNPKCLPSVIPSAYPCISPSVSPSIKYLKSASTYPSSTYPVFTYCPTMSPTTYYPIPMLSTISPTNNADVFSNITDDSNQPLILISVLAGGILFLVVALIRYMRAPSTPKTKIGFNSVSPEEIV